MKKPNSIVLNAISKQLQSFVLRNMLMGTMTVRIVEKSSLVEMVKEIWPITLKPMRSKSKILDSFANFVTKITKLHGN